MNKLSPNNHIQVDPSTLEELIDQATALHDWLVFRDFADNHYPAHTARLNMSLIWNTNYAALPEDQISFEIEDLLAYDENGNILDEISDPVDMEDDLFDLPALPGGTLSEDGAVRMQVGWHRDAPPAIDYDLSAITRRSAQPTKQPNTPYLDDIKKALDDISAGRDTAQTGGIVRTWRGGTQAFAFLERLRQERATLNGGTNSSTARLTAYLLEKHDLIGDKTIKDPIDESAALLDENVLLEKMLTGDWHVTNRLKIRERILETRGKQLVEPALVALRNLTLTPHSDAGNYHERYDTIHALCYLLLPETANDPRVAQMIAENPLHPDMFPIIVHRGLNSLLPQVVQSLYREDIFDTPASALACLQDMDRDDLILEAVLDETKMMMPSVCRMALQGLVAHFDNLDSLRPLMNRDGMGFMLIDVLVNERSDAALNLLERALEEVHWLHTHEYHIHAHAVHHLLLQGKSVSAEALNACLPRNAWQDISSQEMLIALSHASPDWGVRAADAYIQIVRRSPQTHRPINLNDTRLDTALPATMDAFLKRLAQELADQSQDRELSGIYIDLLMQRPHPTMIETLQTLVKSKGRRGKLAALHNAASQSNAWPVPVSDD